MCLVRYFLISVLLLMPFPALAEKSIDDVADGWVKDEIGREPASYDNLLSLPKDWLVGRQVSDTMGGILGRIKDRLGEEEGSFGKPNRRRGPCGAAAVRQASGIASDSAYSQLFRSFAGNTVEVFGAIPGLITNAARFLGQKALEEAEKAVRDHFREQAPEEYTLSKSQENCTLEMRVIWKKAEEKYKFMILGDCGCDSVRCWNFEDRTIPLGRFSVMGEGNVTPRIRQKPNGSKDIQFSIGRVTSLQVRADCCDAGQTGLDLDADPYWVNLTPEAQPATSAPPRPTTGGGAPGRPVTGTTSGSSGSISTAPSPSPTPKPEPIDPNDPAGIGVRPPQLDVPVTVPHVPNGPVCEEEKERLVDAAFAQEHKANRNAQLAANYVVDLAYAGGHHPDAPARLREELQRWIVTRDNLIRTADQINAARKALQALAVKPCAPPANSQSGANAVGGGGTTTSSGGGASSGGKASQEQCPKCTPIRQQIEKTSARKQAKEGELKAKKQSLAPLEKGIKEARQQVERARAPLSGERGTGASSTDTTTGTTTSAYDTGDGRVRITVTDAQGKLIDERFRVRSSASDRRAQLERAEEALQQLLERKKETQNQMQALEQEIGALAKEIATLKKTLAECLKQCLAKPATPSHSIGQEVEIELEDARSVEGVNPLDAHGIGHIGTQETRHTIPALPEVQKPSVTPAQPVPIPYPTQPQPAVQVESAPPVQAPPLSVSHAGTVRFTHMVGDSPCPQPAGTITLRAASGHALEVMSPSATGTLSSRLNLTIKDTASPAPSIAAAFNCSSAQKGTFNGSIMATIKDMTTGETASVSVPANGEVR